MLQLRRRHLTSCPHTSGVYLKCRCPIWVVGALDGKFIRKSLDTANLEKAEGLRRQIEAENGIIERVNVEEACDRWIADCEARPLKPPSFRKHKEIKNNRAARFKGIST